MVQPGDCFLVLHQASGIYHLWVVISWPDVYHHMLLVNLTDANKCNDDSCLFKVGDHPFITKLSAVHYAGARVSSEHVLDEREASGDIKRREFARPRFLRKIQEGARISHGLDFEYHYFRDLMTEQPPPVELVRAVTPRRKVLVKVKRSQARS